MFGASITKFVAAVTILIEVESCCLLARALCEGALKRHVELRTEPWRHSTWREAPRQRLRYARTARLVPRFRVEQVGLRRDGTKLIVQAMKEGSKIARIKGICAIFVHGRRREPADGLVKHRPTWRLMRRASSAEPRSRGRAGWTTSGRGARGCRCRCHPDTIRLSPEGVLEDADATARGSHVFDLACGDPVVDGPSTDSNHLTRLHNADRLALHRSFVPPHNISASAVTGLGDWVNISPSPASASASAHVVRAWSQDYPLRTSCGKFVRGSGCDLRRL